jgi:cytochrome c biogenesis protein CcdA
VTLILIGLVGGIITGLSPCVLPVLPVIFLGGGSTEADGEPARRRPYLVVLGLTLSFAVFTLFGSLILASLHLPDDAIRWLGLALLLLVGLGLLVVSLWSPG